MQKISTLLRMKLIGIVCGIKRYYFYKGKILLVYDIYQLLINKQLV